MEIKDIIDTINPIIECDTENKFFKVIDILNTAGYNILCHYDVIDKTKPICIFINNGDVDYTNNRAIINGYETERRFYASEFIASAKQENLIELYFYKVDDIPGSVQDKPLTFKCKRYSELCDLLAMLKQHGKVWLSGYDLFKPDTLNSLETLMRHPGNDIYITMVAGTGNKVTFDVADEDPKDYIVIEPREHREILAAVV